MGFFVNAGAAQWSGRLYPDAGYAAGRFYGSLRYRPDPPVPGAVAKDPELSRANACARARQKVWLYAGANRLNRLATLTYAPPFCKDPLQLRRDLAAFFKDLRADLGGKPLPYVWVPEYHADRERFHAHFAVGRYIPWRRIDANWPHGGINIKLLGNVPSGNRALNEARAAARYLSKYISNEVTPAGRTPSDLALAREGGRDAGVEQVSGGVQAAGCVAGRGWWSPHW